MAEDDQAPQPPEPPVQTPLVLEPVDEQVSGDQPEMSKDARNMAMLCHLLGLVGFIGPLIIWVSEKDRHRFVDEHGRETMNYQVSLIIYYAAAWLSCAIFIGLLLVPALTIVHIVLAILGAIKANKGEPWRYPIAIRFLK